jgi:opacity protein-like surface antigen
MAQLLRKKMIRLLFVSIMVFASTSLLKAQHLVLIYAHALYDAPLDKNFKENYNSGFGVEGGAGIGWKKTFLIGTVGYTNFFHKDEAEGGDLHYVPVKIGLRQYVFLKNIYIHGDLGLGTIKNKVYSDTRFSGDIGAGVKFVGFEVQLDYDGFTRKEPETSGYSSWIGIKAGFALGL